MISDSYADSIRQLLDKIKQYEDAGTFDYDVAADLHDAVLDLEDYWYTLRLKELQDKAIDKLADRISKSNIMWSDRYWLQKAVLELKKGGDDDATTNNEG